ncbi:MAG: trigger factor [Lachnospiraceae bacterium]|nr:trigger factor [Lachnospiraceae bacterium]
MKKKLNKLGLVVALSMSLSLLGGCGKDNNDKKDNIETTATASAGVDASTASNATREFKEEDYKKLLDNWAGYCTLGEYKKIEYNAETVEVTDDMVKERVEALRNTFAVEDKIMEGTTKNGDTVNIDYVGSIDGVEFQGGSTNGAGFDLVLGSGRFIEGMEEQIENHKVGETFDVNVTFPTEYHVEELAGKDALFKVTINYIVDKKLPEYTDAFIASNTDCSTTAEYEAQAREDIKKLRQEEADNTNRNTVLQLVVDNAKVESYPEEEITKLVEKVVASYEESAKSSGITLEELLKTYFQIETVDDFKKQLDEQARDFLKQKIVVCAIAKAENMTLTKEEITAIEEKIILNNAIDRETMESQYSMDDIIYFTISEKVNDFIVDQAVAK